LAIPNALYFDLKIERYWRADGDITDVSHRGYQIFQSIQNPDTASEFDRNVGVWMDSLFRQQVSASQPQSRCGSISRDVRGVRSF